MALVKERKVVVDSEPDATKIVSTDENYRAKLIFAFNWYNTEKDSKQARVYLLEWAKKHRKEKLAIITETDSRIPDTYGWVARLITRGAVLASDELKSFNDFIDALKPKKAVVVVKETPKKSIQEAIKDKTAEILGELEWVVDQQKLGLLDKGFTPKAHFESKQIGKVYLPAIETWAKTKMAHYLEVMKSKDKQIIEGYSNYKKKEFMALLSLLKAFIDDSQAYTQEKKANRKPRAKKVKPAGVQVKALKYKLEDKEMKLKSINPSDIVGAQQLWVFNTKYRKLGVYKTDSAMGLQVKGTTIQNYLPEESIQKTLRKPDQVIKKLMEAGKVALRKLLDDVNAIDVPLNGRINDETILLRVVK